jgi:hypothetical protein
VTVTDTDSGTKSPPQGTVDMEVTAQPAGSTAAVSPDPCALTPDPSPATDDSSCTVTFTADTTGSYTVKGTYQPAPASVHAASSGTDTITVTARTTSTTVDCPASTPANSPATCTVTVTDTDSGTKSPPQGTVDMEVTAQPAGSTAAVSPDPCALTPNLDGESSSCQVAFTSTTAGSYTIKGTYVPAPASVHATSSGSDTIEVTPGPPAIVTVDPPTAVNEVDEEHCVTATVTDAFGNPNPGVKVLFSVTGSNQASGSGTTDADGTTEEFCYTGVLFGEDVIRATADTDEDGTADPGEPFGTATKTWTPPEPPFPCDVIITEGGWIVAQNGDRASFGGNAHDSPTGEPSGQQEYQDHGPVQPMNVHSTSIVAVVCSENGKQASIFGTARIDGSPVEFVFRIDVQDLGEPGVGQDTYRIRLSNGYDSGGGATGPAGPGNVLMGGNIQIHLLSS